MMGYHWNTWKHLKFKLQFIYGTLTLLFIHYTQQDQLIFIDILSSLSLSSPVCIVYSNIDILFCHAYDILFSQFVLESFYKLMLLFEQKCFVHYCYTYTSLLRIFLYIIKYKWAVKTIRHRDSSALFIFDTYLKIIDCLFKCLLRAS